MGSLRAKRSVTVGEVARLAEDAVRTANGKRWGPYLAERQWGTVREDYSANGTCWNSFPHDHARSRAYRWGEDGLLGITDRECRLCFALSLWNGQDPILKERLFGLTNEEGNHGEDVKEVYYYLDSTPTHSYMRALYKYPQSEFPYEQLVTENRWRGLDAPEFELADTGVFKEDRYFDVETEYAKAAVHYVFKLAADTSQTVCLRLYAAKAEAGAANRFGEAFDAVIALRKQEADAFYASMLPDGIDDDARTIARQAYAGLLWSKQFDHYILRDWLSGDPDMPRPPVERHTGRNAEWHDLSCFMSISMPRPAAASGPANQTGWTALVTRLLEKVENNE